MTVTLDEDKDLSSDPYNLEQNNSRLEFFLFITTVGALIVVVMIVMLATGVRIKEIHEDKTVRKLNVHVNLYNIQHENINLCC
jgi:hypothetical protein